MMNSPFYYTGSHLPLEGNDYLKGPFVVASQMGDVTGDGVVDCVYLIATKQENSPYLTNITLMIQDGRTKGCIPILLPENSGYNPTIWLGDLTGNHVKDILIVIDTGGSGGIVLSYVFSFINGKMAKIFDSTNYYEKHNYGVHYANQYKAVVTSSKPNKKYILDLQYKGQEYLNEIYNDNGTLKQPISGWVDPIGVITPIDLDRSGKYDLLTMEQISGRYHADGLGYVENLLHWDGKKFTVFRQTVAIYGEEFA